jgi:hypothetical protein
VIAVACLLCGRSAAAQPATPASDDTTPEDVSGPPQWELEVHGGLGFDRAGSGGTITMPITGSTVQGLPSFSTFYLGAGTTLFNQLRPGSPITPLDPALTAPAITRGTGAAFGLRLQRAITKRYAIEFNGDFVRGPHQFSDSTLSTIEASRASFASALGATLGPSATVTSTVAMTDKVEAIRATATGTFVVNLKTSGRTIPYLVAGAGIVFNNGDLPVATLTGTYLIGSPSSLSATDTVTLSYTESSHSLVYVGGAGVKHMLSTRIGLRVDARVHVYKNSIVNVLDVTPDHQAVTNGQAPPVINAGGLQFSTLGPLNGASYAGAQTFVASGLQAQASVTAGFFIRF